MRPGVWDPGAPLRIMLQEKEFKADEQDSPETAADASGEQGEIAEIRKLIAERDAARGDKAELLDRYQRAQAEFENARKRMQREREETREYAAMEVIEALLPIVDDFERALTAEGIDPEVRKGLELIDSRIQDVFERLGLKRIDAHGVFDPELHMAVDRAPAGSDEQDQQILEAYRPGYKFKDRLLRPAMVKVAVKE